MKRKDTNVPSYAGSFTGIGSDTLTPVSGGAGPTHREWVLYDSHIVGGRYHGRVFSQRSV